MLRRVGERTAHALVTCHDICRGKATATARAVPGARAKASGAVSQERNSNSRIAECVC